jgi:hypothetical protein
MKDVVVVLKEIRLPAMANDAKPPPAMVLPSALPALPAGQHGLEGRLVHHHLGLLCVTW